MFTDKFITLPIQVFDRKLAELTNEETCEDSYMKVDPFQISSYRPSWDAADTDKKEIVSMTTKTGDTTLIYLTVVEFEKLLNDHQNK